MPNRYLREGILTSERVNKLAPHAEVFYRRLMSVVDDYGRFEANPKLLRASCYPLRVDEVREADISRWLTEVESAGLIALYAANGKNYLELLGLGEPRAKSSKYPDRFARENTCAHVNANAPPPPSPSVPITIPPPPRARGKRSIPATAQAIFEAAGVKAAGKCAVKKGMNPAEALLIVEYARAEKPAKLPNFIYAMATKDFEPACTVTPETICRWAREGKLKSVHEIPVNGELGHGSFGLRISGKTIPEVLTERIVFKDLEAP